MLQFLKVSSLEDVKIKNEHLFVLVQHVIVILDTDYTNYSIEYNCKSIGENKSQQLFWLLSRTPELTANTEILARIEEVKAKYIDQSLVVPVTMM
jgi:hypothetical protein